MARSAEAGRDGALHRARVARVEAWLRPWSPPPWDVERDPSDPDRYTCSEPTVLCVRFRDAGVRRSACECSCDRQLMTVSMVVSVAEPRVGYGRCVVIEAASDSTRALLWTMAQLPGGGER